MMMKWISVKYASLKKTSDENYRCIGSYSCNNMHCLLPCCGFKYPSCYKEISTVIYLFFNDAKLNKFSRNIYLKSFVFLLTLVIQFSYNENLALIFDN